jgi:hypothetical protein
MKKGATQRETREPKGIGALAQHWQNLNTTGYVLRLLQITYHQGCC